MMDVLFSPDCPIKKVFLCGKITGDPSYQVKFLKAAYVLEKGGFAVMNPAVLPPQGFTHEEYMTVTLAMLSVCDAVCYLDDWMDSEGAVREIETATQAGKPGFSFGIWHEHFKRKQQGYFDKAAFAT